MMTVLLIEPGKKPRKAEIDGSLAGMQQVVGGYIQATFPFDDPVALECNEEGKMLGHPLNRALRDDEGDIYDIVAGTFFICGALPDSENFTSLGEEYLEKYHRWFCYPELFVKMNGKIVCIPVVE